MIVIDRAPALLSAVCLALSSGARAQTSAPEHVPMLDDVPPETCAPCHEMQFDEWAVSMHAAGQVQCSDCHGSFHSASLLGCKHCHNAMHRNRIEHWPQVQRFDAGGDASDYICLVCHDAHNSSLRKSLIGCYSCHGGIAHAALSDIVHSRLASAITPVHMDEFARERDGIVPRLMTMPRWSAALIILAGSPVLYFVCFVTVLPFGYSAASVWSFFTSSSRREDDTGSA